MSPSRVRHRLQRAGLRSFQLLPRRLRTALVHLGAPSYTVGSMCVIEDGDGRRLLIRHAYRPGWGLPGGLMKRRETPEQCARREVREEVGLAVELLGPPRPVVYPKPRRVDFVFKARPVETGAAPRARPDATEVVETRWFGRDEPLPDLQWEASRALATV